MASQSQSKPQPQKRDVADFFKPYARSIPAKRPSPTPESILPHERPIKTKKVNPKTPTSKSRFKDVAVSPFKTPFSPRSGASAKLPIRTTPKKGQTPTSICSSNPLFLSSVKKQSESTPNLPADFSFSDLPTLGQSVVKDGKVIAVRDSEDDDSDSLESLEDIFGGPKKAPSSTSSPMENNEARAETQRRSKLKVFSRSNRTAPLVGKEKLRTIFARAREHKFDITNLVIDHLDDQEVKDRLDEAKQDYEASAQEVQQSEMDRNLLSAIMAAQGGNGEDMARLVCAMERTDALSSENTFSFFGSKGLEDWQDQQPDEYDFPAKAIPDELWVSGDCEAQNRAYLSGYIGELAAKGQLADSLLHWTFRSVVLENREELRSAYIQCLSQASPWWTRANVTASDVRAVFETLGASTATLKDGSDITPNHYNSLLRRRRNPEYLLSILELFNSIANDLDFTALSKLTSILSRLALDAEAMSDRHISTAVEDTLSKLLNLTSTQSHQHVAERMLSDVGDHLEDPSLQFQLLKHILPISPLAANVRIKLAQRFLFGPPAEPQPVSDPPKISLPILLNHLTSPAFDLAVHSRDEPVDYASLSATAHLFDIALSDGGRPPLGSPDSEAKRFNRQLDTLADRVHILFTSIADTGASHMRRTEAKEVLFSLHYRLLYALRTQPRLKKNVFGGRDGEEYRAEERGKGVLRDFLKGKKTKGVETEAENEVEGLERLANVSIVNGAVVSSQSTLSESEAAIRKQLGLSSSGDGPSD